MNGFSLTIGCIGLLLSGLAVFIILTASSRAVIALTVAAVMLLLSPIIIPTSYTLYATYSRLIFSLDQDGSILLAQSPFKMPMNADSSYCRQFRDTSNHVIEQVSQRDDGSYCGEFWQFYERKPLFIAYKKMNNNQLLYWASPQLQIIGPIPQIQPLKIQFYEENSLKG